MPSGFDVNTWVMAVTILYSFILSALQSCSNSWNINHGRHKSPLVLYSIYFSSILCAVQCFLMHNSHHFPHFYCRYGMSICVILYSLEKGCMYAFFLKRAKMTQGCVTTFPPMLFDKLLPIWIVMYVVVFAILCPILYHGTIADPSQAGIVTGCLFTHHYPYLFFVASFVDVINCVVFLFLFCQPWRQSLEMLDVSFADLEISKQEFMNVLRWNVVLSAMSSMSSVSFLVFMSTSTHALSQYAWLGGNVDMIINATCVFFMMAINRSFCRQRVLGLQPKPRSHSMARIETSTFDTPTARLPMASISRQTTLHSNIDIKDIKDESRTHTAIGTTVVVTVTVEETEWILNSSPPQKPESSSLSRGVKIL